MKSAFRLSSQDLSHDAITSVEHLLTQLKAGEIIGVAYVAMCKRREYVLSVSGEAHRNPTFTRGMVAALDDELREMVHR